MIKIKQKISYSQELQCSNDCQKYDLEYCYDKECSPYEYYVSRIKYNHHHICICLNQEYVTVENTCEICGGKIIRI